MSIIRNAHNSRLWCRFHIWLILNSIITLHSWMGYSCLTVKLVSRLFWNQLFRNTHSCLWVLMILFSSSQPISGLVMQQFNNSESMPRSCKTMEYVQFTVLKGTKSMTLICKSTLSRILTSEESSLFVFIKKYRTLLRDKLTTTSSWLH